MHSISVIFASCVLMIVLTASSLSL